MTIEVNIKSADDFYRLYMGSKKWLILDKPAVDILYATLVITTDTEARWKGFPVYRTITDVEPFGTKKVIVSLK